MFSGVALTSGFSNLNFTVSVNNGNVSGVNGYFPGLTLGASYNDQGNQQSNENCGSVTVVTQGTIDYSLFWNGVGVLYSQPVRYHLIIDCEELIVNGTGMLIMPVPHNEP